MISPLLRRTLGAAACVATGTLGLLLGSAAWVRLASRGRLYPASTVPDAGFDALPHAEVAMVLGAEAYPDGRPSPALAARLDLGYELLARGVVRRLLLTGDGTTPGLGETGAMARYLTDRGVDPARLLIDPAGVDTHASCRHARTRGHTHLVVVSQTFHLPRAIALARACGIDAIGVGDDTLRCARGEWARGEIRERFAALKAVTDVVTHLVRFRHNAPEARNASRTDT